MIPPAPLTNKVGLKDLLEVSSEYNGDMVWNHNLWVWWLNHCAIISNLGIAEGHGFVYFNTLDVQSEQKVLIKLKWN